MERHDCTALSFARTRIHIEEKSDDGLDLVFETIRKKNQGEYVCKATVDGEEHEAKFTLSVFSKSIGPRRDGTR